MQAFLDGRPSLISSSTQSCTPALRLRQTVIKTSCGVFKAKGGLESQCDPEKHTHVTTGTDKVENVGGTTAAFHLPHV